MSIRSLLATLILCAMFPQVSRSQSATAAATAAATVLPNHSEELRDSGTVYIEDQRGNIYHLNSEQRYRLAISRDTVVREVVPATSADTPLRIYLHWQ